MNTRSFAHLKAIAGLTNSVALSFFFLLRARKEKES